jgi:pyruvate kinase
MKIKKDLIKELIAEITEIIHSANELENRYYEKIHSVDACFRSSAVNLVHYMALREHDISGLQENLRDYGLSPFDHIEPHVMRSLLLTKILLQRLIGIDEPISSRKTVSVKKSGKILTRNARALFGEKTKKRRARIMVTMPEEAAGDHMVVAKFLKAGMNCARINCATYDVDVWQKMINNIEKARTISRKGCRVMMDLAGPKLRTGPMIPGPKVLHIKPGRDDTGNVSKPAKLWLAPPGEPLPPEADAVIPVDSQWLKKLSGNDVITFTDSRQKKCSLTITGNEGSGKWGLIYDSAYIMTGTEFILKKEGQEQEMAAVGEFLPIEQSITLKPGDTLLLHKELSDGEPARYDHQGNLIQPAHISCTMPEIFNDVKPGEPVLFDDGKIEGIIESVNNAEVLVRIINARDLGSKLRAGKGINFPSSELSFSGMTAKDRHDLRFVAEHADAVNVSFVNKPEDVTQLLDEFQKAGKQIGIILKIETRKGYKNLPLIILEAMQVYPLGVMIARGDLAVEVGWNEMALVQEEILRVCEAAHIPDIWATQVLENMTKKGTPSRAEITDAAMAQRAECVMLNKGRQVTKAIKMLDRILKSMQEINKKKTSVLPKLPDAHNLKLGVTDSVKSLG